LAELIQEKIGEEGAHADKHEQRATRGKRDGLVRLRQRSADQNTIAPRLWRAKCTAANRFSASAGKAR
jgi:hypothetical protein